MLLCTFLTTKSIIPQVTILLKECRDVQLRCGSMGHYHADETINCPVVELNADSDTENVISERLVNRVAIVFLVLNLASPAVPYLLMNVDSSFYI